MPNTYSKLATAETTHGVLGDREHIEELEKHIFRLQESLRDLTKKYNDLSNYLQRGGPVEEAPEHQIQQLATQLEETEIRNEKLEDENQKLRKEKYFAVLSKAKLEKVLVEREKSKLKADHKKYLQHQTQKYKLCDKDCVVWSLLWICNEKLDECLCGRQLEKIITVHAERKHRINYKELCCEYFMPILEKCDIASQKFTMKYHNEYRDKETHEVWQELLRVDAKDLVLMVLIKYLGGDGFGHCMVYDLERRNEGLLEYHDLQNGVREELRGKEDLKEYVENAEGITLYTVDTEHLRKVINCHKDNPTDTGCDCERMMLRAPPAKRVACNTEHVASAACAAERAACDAERAARAAERAERAACDTKPSACAACDAERAACAAERAACDAERAAWDAERAACDAERAACDTDSSGLGSSPAEHL